VKLYIGIDPGLDGALVATSDKAAYFWDTPSLLVGTKRQPDVAAMSRILDQEVEGASGIGRPGWRVAIEAVHSMPKQGVASSFAFGFGYGVWFGLLTALGISFETVSPQRWKKSLMDGMPREKDSSRQRAMQLFPKTAEDLKLKKHHGRADALLIAEWRRRTG